MTVSRRNIILASAAFAAMPKVSLAATPLEISWDDLIPPGLPYGEIIGEGEMDMEQDTWRPIFDENASKLNELLDGAYVKLPGYIIPIDQSTKGVTSFILVPYVGACIHTPPPPPNQLVFVTSSTPWPYDNLWNPVWVVGEMSNEMKSTDLAETGYALKAERIEVYEW